MIIAHSIRWRFLLWLGFLLLIVLTGFAVSVYQLQKTTRYQQLDEELQSRVASVSADLRRPPFGPGRPPPGPWPDKPPPSMERRRLGGPGGPGDRHDGPPFEGFRDPRAFPRELSLRPEVAALFDAAKTNGFYFVVWNRDRSELKRSSNAPPAVAIPERQGNDTRVHVREQGPFREAFQFTERGDAILAGRTMLEQQKELDKFLFGLLAAGGSVLALGLGGGWLLASRAIRPIEAISAAAVRISEGNLSERIDVPDPRDELGRLAVVLNSTFTKLEAAFEQQRQFTADASHELRTPLAVLISEAQTTLARERDAAAYKETVEACLDAAQQMRRLTESLLDLARFDAGHQEIQLETVDLQEVARSTVERIQPLARQHQIVIETGLSPAKVAGDAGRLGQVVTNLLSNAIYYNKDQGKIRVACWVEGTQSVLSVEDTGQGIASDDLPKIFDRFFRADKSRSRAQGRNGLGLAICKAIIEAHHGTMEASSTLGVGTLFTVRLPVAHQSAPGQHEPQNVE